MADLEKIIEGIASGLLTGGVSVATTLLAVFRDTKKRISDLEKRLGLDKEDEETGLFLQFKTLSESFRKLKREVEGWDEDPPAWAVKLYGRARSNSSIDLNHQREYEERIELRVRELSSKLRSIEEDVKNLPSTDRFITHDEYHEDSQKRGEEIARIRTNLASANGMLRGVMAALGYVDGNEPKKRDR